MKRVLRTALIATSPVLLAACASSGGMASAPMASPSYQVGEQVVMDVQYVGAVEQTARRRGVSVHWVNPPQKRIPAELASR